MRIDPDRPLSALADAAFRRIVEKVKKRAIDTGTPLILWEDGAIIEVDPHTGKKWNRPEPAAKSLPLQ